MALSSQGADRVLIIEDDSKIAHLVKIHLQDLGYEPDWAVDGRSGLQYFHKSRYALVILDLMLPDMDGIEVCKSIRATSTYTPILMLTAKSEELDVVLGLELGADDYVTKPFSVRELIARIKALFRRIDADRQSAGRLATTETLTFGELAIHPGKRRVTLRNQLVELTAKEYDLLELFARNPGYVYNRSELLEQVWGYHFDGYAHTVNSLINRLRRKIEIDPSKPVYIETVWGVGYRFVEQNDIQDR